MGFKITGLRHHDAYSALGVSLYQRKAHFGTNGW
jgi:hypothetical protein